MAVAEVAMIIAGAKKAVNFCNAFAEAHGDFSQCIDNIKHFYDCADQIKEAEERTSEGDYFSRNSVEAEALQKLNANYQMQQMESTLRQLIVWNMSEGHYIEFQRDRKRLREARLAAVRRKAHRRKMMIDGVFIFTCVVGTLAFVWSILAWILGFTTEIL